MDHDHDWAEVKLDNLAGGAVGERFEDALKEVIENIVDPNCDHEAARGITIHVKFKPSKNDENKVSYSLSVKTNLAPPKSVENVMFVGSADGQLKAFEQNADQGNLFNEEGKIREIDLKENTND